MKTDNYHKIQVLAGEDVSRKRAEMLVTVHNGAIHTYAAEGPAWKPFGTTNIKGWGDLDGPAVDFDLGVCGDYTVPVRELERIGAADVLLDKFAIAWDDRGRMQLYNGSNTPATEECPSSTILYDTAEEADAVIDKNDWHRCNVIHVKMLTDTVLDFEPATTKHWHNAAEQATR